MVTVRRGLVVGSAALVALLAVLAATVGLGFLGWGVGLACAALTIVGVARGTSSLGPADLVTLGRAVLTCGLAGLVADSFLHEAAVGTIVVGAVVALASDLFDGWLARRTRTESDFGARFDGEVDAFLILVLSVYVAEAVTHIGMIVDPDAVLVGGRLPVRMIDELLRYTHEHLQNTDPDLPSIHRASLMEDASALGGAVMPMAAALMLSSANPEQRTRSPLKFMDRLNA